MCVQLLIYTFNFSAKDRILNYWDASGTFVLVAIQRAIERTIKYYIQEEHNV